MFIITVHFVIKEGHVNEFVEAMKTNAAQSLSNEERCRQFEVCQDPKDPRRIFLYEVYDDSAAFDHHLKTNHFLEFDKTVADWTEAKVAEKWSLLNHKSDQVLA